MPRGNDFQEIVGGIFAIIVFIIIGSAIAGSLATSIDFSGIISGVFILGMVIIGLALAIKIFKIFEDMFN